MSISVVNNFLSFVLGWLILEIVLCFSSEIETTCVRFNINYSIGKRLPVFPLKSVDGMGPGACYMKCQRVRDCLSVNYNRKHFICELLGQKKTDVEPLISDEDFIHIDLPDTIDPKDELCGDVMCNNYSICIRTLFNHSVCIATECAEPLPTLENGIVIGKSYSPISATFGCSPGYTAVGTVNTIHCHPGGKWSSLSYSCHAPVNGGWGMWNEWNSCSKSCEGGTKVRTRPCNNPVPSFGGSDCSGTSADSEICNTHICPIDGGWGPWREWGACSESCDGGHRTRNRDCNNPVPSNGGSYCSGSQRGVVLCNIHACAR